MRPLRTYKPEVVFLLAASSLCGAILIGLFRYSVLSAAFTALAFAAFLLATLLKIQRVIIARSTVVLRVENHPALGTVKIYRNNWQCEIAVPTLASPFILAGQGHASAPCSKQVTLWQTIREHFKVLIDAGLLALSAQLQSVDPPLQRDELRLVLVDLRPAQEFMFFFMCPRRHTSIRRGLYVRYEGMTVADAGWTPATGRRKNAKG